MLAIFYVLLCRYMMLIKAENEVYFIDRENCIFTTDKFLFPRRKNPDEHICDTLVDGELVNDKEGDQVKVLYIHSHTNSFQFWTCDSVTRSHSIKSVLLVGTSW